MKIYIVESINKNGCYSEVISVFSTEAKAKSEAKRHDDLYSDWESYVEKFELDKVYEAP